MGDKSYVSVEQHQCFACGVLYDTGSILMNRRLRPSFERHTVTGTGLCPEHQKMRDDGYILLLGALDKKGEHRTGDILAVKTEVFEQMFNVPVPKGGVCFIAPEAIKQLTEMAEHAERQEDSETTASTTCSVVTNGVSTEDR